MSPTISTASSRRIRVDIFGDSQAQGRVEHPDNPSSLVYSINPTMTTLLGYLSGGGEIANCAKSGYNTDAAVDLIPLLVEDLQARDFTPDYAVVMLGTNDALCSEVPSGQHVPLDRFGQNIETIGHTLDGFAPVVMFVPPVPAVPSAMTEDSIYLNLKGFQNDVIKAYGSAIMSKLRRLNETSKSTRFYFADLATPLISIHVKPETDASEYTTDGVHIKDKSFHVLEGVLRAFNLPGLTSDGGQTPTVTRPGQDAPHFLAWKECTCPEEFRELYYMPAEKRPKKAFDWDAGLRWVQSTTRPDCQAPGVTQTLTD